MEAGCARTQRAILREKLTNTEEQKNRRDFTPAEIASEHLQLLRFMAVAAQHWTANLLACHTA